MNKNVLKDLLILCSTHPETSEEINRLVMEYNLQLPYGQLTPSTSGSSYSTLRCSSSDSSYPDSTEQPSPVPTVTLQLNL